MLPQTLRERIVVIQGGLLVVMAIAAVLLTLWTASAERAASCHAVNASAISANQETRAALGNEGRAAASALAASVVSAAADPAGIRASQIHQAEQVYSSTMQVVNSGLAAHPLLPPAGC